MRCVAMVRTPGIAVERGLNVQGDHVPHGRQAMNQSGRDPVTPGRRVEVGVFVIMFAIPLDQQQLGREAAVGLAGEMRGLLQQMRTIHRKSRLERGIDQPEQVVDDRTHGIAIRQRGTRRGGMSGITQHGLDQPLRRVFEPVRVVVCQRRGNVAGHVNTLSRRPVGSTGQSAECGPDSTSWWRRDAV